MYIGWDGREYEDAEMDNMREEGPAETWEEEMQRIEQERIGYLYSQLQPLISSTNRTEEYYQLGGWDGPRPIYCLQKALQRALADVRQLRYHEHQWNENDYCDICGNDGRA